MKKSILAIIITFSSLLTKAQWTTNGSGDAINNNSSGKVGIGTAPLEALHINGNIRGNVSGALRISSGNGYIDVGAQNSSWAHIYTDRPYFIFNQSVWSIPGGFSSYSSADLTLQTNGTTRMTVSNSTGNVGIGTTAPAAKLSFNNLNDGSNNPDGITWYSPSPLVYGIYRTAGVWTAPNYQQLQLNFDTGIILNPGSSYGKSYVDIQGGGLRVTSGNVGIGTSSPTYPLDVQGPVSRLLNPSTTAGAYTSFRVQGPNYTNGLEIDFFGNNNISTDLNWSYGGGAGSVAIVNVNSKPLTFGTNNQGRMIIDATGNVGIGTFAPDAKLAVSGQVHAQEVKVSVAVPGPDYVFEKDYKLTSLEEIKNYIDQNKHLPEVPSAKEMEKNGVQLGEMNMLLLKKIEELTLHVIELKRENTELKDYKNQIDQLRTDLNKLMNASK